MLRSSDVLVEHSFLARQGPPLWTTPGGGPRSWRISIGNNRFSGTPCRTSTIPRETWRSLNQQPAQLWKRGPGRFASPGSGSIPFVITPQSSPAAGTSPFRNVFSFANINTNGIGSQDSNEPRFQSRPSPPGMLGWIDLIQLLLDSGRGFRIFSFLGKVPCFRPSRPSFPEQFSHSSSLMNGCRPAFQHFVF